MKRDILIFMSDQHGAWAMGGDNGLVETPVLDDMRSRGVEFANTYTPCPLCVPARMAMLSGRLPGDTGILLNDDTLPDMTPTFLHNLVKAGYETVLAGRMHFVGADQRHGFIKRIAPDITPVTWNRPEKRLREERGIFAPAFGAKGCTFVTGGGNSPVLYYDRMVVDAALEYLSEPHEKPQFILVGVYAPHFPYVAPVGLYKKYRAKATLARSFYDTPDYMNPFLLARQNHADEETALSAQAAYFGMIEQMDRHLGELRESFQGFCSRRGTEPVICYISDHGDELGARGIFGKWTFFERSTRVPFIIDAPGLPEGKREMGLASLLDVGPTICRLAGAESPDGAGMDLITLMQGGTWPERSVVSQLIEPQADGSYCYGVMVRKARYKWIRYHGHEKQDMLFDLEKDPDETENLVSKKTLTAEEMSGIAKKTGDAGMIEHTQELHKKRADLLRAVETMQGVEESERWRGNPGSGRICPEI